MKKLLGLMTETETADELGVAVKTLRNWRWSGTGPPFVKVGDLVRYRPDELVRWVESRSSGAGTPQGAA